MFTDAIHVTMLLPETGNALQGNMQLSKLKFPKLQCLQYGSKGKQIPEKGKRIAGPKLTEYSSEY